MFYDYRELECTCGDVSQRGDYNIQSPLLTRSGLASPRRLLTAGLGQEHSIFIVCT